MSDAVEIKYKKAYNKKNWKLIFRYKNTIKMPEIFKEDIILVLDR